MMDYKVLVDEPYLVISDDYRLGPNPKWGDEEFYLEDNIGRGIPFTWKDLDKLIKGLNNLKVVKEVIKELEEDRVEKRLFKYLKEKLI
jgi:hypothetical protein